MDALVDTLKNNMPAQKSLEFKLEKNQSPLLLL